MSDLDDLDLRMYDEPYEGPDCPDCGEPTWGLHGTREPRCENADCPSKEQP